MTSLPMQATNSFWRAKAHDLDKHRTTQDLPSSADIVIVGAGFTGASIAHHILAKCKASNCRPPNVLILEARQACSGATGRNGGQLKPDLYNRVSGILSNYGPQRAAELTKFELDNFQGVTSLIQTEKIDCDFVQTRTIDVYLRESDFTAAVANIEKLQALQVPGSDSIEVMARTPTEAERVSKVKGAKGVLSYAAGHLSPYKLVMHLLGQIVEQGVNLQTHTPVLSIQRSSSGTPEWFVSTERGNVRAKKVIHASNGYAASLIPELKSRIVPVRGVCCRISPRVPVPWSTNSYMIRHADWSFEYIVSRKDGSIVVGGGRQVYYHKLDSWWDTTDDSELIENAEEFFQDYMQRFHGWEESDASIDKIWTGIMGYSRDGSPYVGEMPELPGQFVCAGFGGHGMPQIFLSAEHIASAVIGIPCEAKLPKVFAVTQDRLAAGGEHASLKTWRSVVARPQRSRL